MTRAYDRVFPPPPPPHLSFLQDVSEIESSSVLTLLQSGVLSVYLWKAWRLNSINPNQSHTHATVITSQLRPSCQPHLYPLPTCLPAPHTLLVQNHSYVLRKKKQKQKLQQTKDKNEIKRVLFYQASDDLMRPYKFGATGLWLVCLLTQSITACVCVCVCLWGRHATAHLCSHPSRVAFSFLLVMFALDTRGF